MSTFLTYLNTNPIIAYLHRAGFVSDLHDRNPTTTNWVLFTHPACATGQLFILEREKVDEYGVSYHICYKWEYLEDGFSKSRRKKVKTEQHLMELLQGTQAEAAFRAYKLALLNGQLQD